MDIGYIKNATPDFELLEKKCTEWEVILIKNRKIYLYKTIIRDNKAIKNKERKLRMKKKKNNNRSSNNGWY